MASLYFFKNALNFYYFHEKKNESFWFYIYPQRNKIRLSGFGSYKIIIAFGR